MRYYGAYSSVARARRQIGDEGRLEPVGSEVAELPSTAERRRIAYGSQATGSWQIWVRPFPGPGAARQVSLDGGMTPLWSPDGSELFYRGAGQVVTVTVELEGESLELGRPRPLFRDTFRFNGFAGVHFWALHPDGRFVMSRAVESSESQRDRIVVVENWVEEVERLLAQ